MKITDITRVLDENTPVYPGDPAFEKQVIKTSGFTICKISMSSHAGTHMDAPSHTDGSVNIKDIPLKKLIGPCTVCETVDDVRQSLSCGIRKILYKGPLENLKMIASLDIELAGIEGLSVGDYEMHQAFLKKGVVILEGLLLDGVPKGRYLLAAMPLKTDLDGSPARVVLIETEGFK